MVNVFIVHGTYGNPGENWIPWLKSELEKDGYGVVVPKFPTPENQNLDAWMRVFSLHLDEIKSDSILIGHSLGCAFLLNLLQRESINVGTVILVAGFIGKLGIEELDFLNADIADVEFNFKLIKHNANKFILFNSFDDPYIPIDKAFDLQRELDGELHLVKNAGHFNSESGYKKFEKLKEYIINFTPNQKER